MTREDRPAWLAWMTPNLIAVAAWGLAIVAFVLLWQIREKLQGVHLAAKVSTVSLPENFQLQALRFVAFAALLALVALVAAVNAGVLAVATRAALVAASGVLLVHAATLAPEVWMHDMAKPYPGYRWFMVAGVLLMLCAGVSELYRAIRTNFYPDDALPEDLAV